MTIDDVKNMVKLTPEQQRAWNRLAKAHKDFLALDGKYYTCLGTVHGYNGKNISHVKNDERGDDPDLNVSNYYMPSINDDGLCSFADDTHVFVLDVDE